MFNQPIPFVYMEMAVCLHSAVLPIPLTVYQRGSPQVLNAVEQLDLPVHNHMIL